MVSVPVVEPIERTGQENVQALPRARPGTASPFEFASFAIGLPGALISAVLTMVLAMYGMQGHALFAWSAVIVLLGAYLGTLAVLWLATASSQD